MYPHELPAAITAAMNHAHPKITTRGGKTRTIAWDGDSATLAAVCEWVRSFDECSDVIVTTKGDLRVRHHTGRGVTSFYVRPGHLLAFSAAAQFTACPALGLA